MSMDILRKNLGLLVSNLEKTTVRTSDTNAITALNLAKSCRAMAKDVRPARRWVSIDERMPSYDGVYEVIMTSSAGRTVNYIDFNAYAEEFDAPKGRTVTHWRKEPRLPS